jgi:hypothetical protein
MLEAQRPRLEALGGGELFDRVRVALSGMEARTRASLPAGRTAD